MRSRVVAERSLQQRGEQRALRFGHARDVDRLEEAALDALEQRHARRRGEQPRHLLTQRDAQRTESLEMGFAQPRLAHRPIHQARDS